MSQSAAKRGCSSATPAETTLEGAGQRSEALGEAQPLLHEEGKRIGVWALPRHFGWQFLVFLFCSQHVTKGFVGDVVRASQRYVLREYGVSAPRMATYDGVIALPWALKPVIGVIADSCPIGGFSKMPYILLAASLGMCSLLSLGALQHSLAVTGVVVLLFAVSLYLSIVDLLSEAVVARELRANPAAGPSLVAFVWGGVDTLGIVAAVFGGFFLTYYTPWTIFTLAAIPASFVMWPTLLNWMGEPQLSEEQTAAQCQSMWAQREALVMAAIMLASTLLLSYTGMRLTVNQNACVTVAVLIGIATSYSVVLNPVIAKVNAFGLMQASLQLSMSSASFYFMIDDSLQYPDGPHFSVQFYSVVLPVCGNLASVLGIWLYNRHSHQWTYQKMYIVGNLVGCATNILDIVFYLRLNNRLGIPDTAFVLGSSALQDTMREWLWMPSAVLISHMCPRGMEAIMYANLAGCHNLGYTASINLGAWLLQALRIEPSGGLAERHQFDNLWIAALFSSLLPVIAVAFVPWFIPDKLSTESIFENSRDISASEGSLLRHWMGWDSPPVPLSPRYAGSQEPAVEPEPEALAHDTVESA